VSVTSPFPESDWDRRLDTMLQDLETTNGSAGGQMAKGNSFTQQQSSSYSFSSSSSSQQMTSSSNSRGQQQQHSQSMQQHSHQSSGTNQPPTKYAGYSLNKSASSVSLKDSAGGVLKDLEDGLVKSSNYIQESHGKYVGPEGTKEWHEVNRDAKPTQEFNLEMQVQHMMPSIMSANNSKPAATVSQPHYQQQQQQQFQQQQQQQQFTAYKVQSNQYVGGGGERVTGGDDDDERPGSRLKQNIDDLDSLLYDLNNARNLSPDGGPEYTASSDNFGLDSDDYSETVGKEGHVKRTVTAFNEYSTNMAHADVATKPPSPSPRRKAPGSPNAGRRVPPSPGVHQTSSVQQSYKVQTTSTSHNQNQNTIYQPASGPPGSGQPFTYTDQPTSPALNQPSFSPPPSTTPEPNYYAKYSSTKQQTTRSQDTRTAVPFPHQSAHSPTPQNPPKRVDELMSEFQEFDSVHKGGSPTPAMFCKPSNSTLEVTELPDGPPLQARLEPEIRKPDSPPAAVQPPPSKEGPKVYYPPGSEFTKAEPTPRPAADCGSMSLEGGGKGKAKASRERAERGRYEDGENKQGAAVIPICLPLCCAAPCVIL